MGDKGVIKNNLNNRIIENAMHKIARGDKELKSSQRTVNRENRTMLCNNYPIHVFEHR